ncbi:MAG TPA: transposase [Candidatus Caccocola faecigallinarum]|nr:transposase [Candidatus Caccocola faecigallinarum]
MNNQKNRGVEDIFIPCTDNLKGFASAINAVFLKTEIQNCIIHQLRNSGKDLSYKDIKELMNDLKTVYTTPDEQLALDTLEAFGYQWDKNIQRYPELAAQVGT